MIEITVIKGRTCFWEKILKNNEPLKEQLGILEIKCISIADSLNKYFDEYYTDVEELYEDFLPNELFSSEKTDVRIINWDSINTDPVYGSDRAYQFFNHYRTGLNKWVENGGILILEAQSAQWILVQESYNIFDENIVTTQEVQGIGTSGKINTKLANIHPILHTIGDSLGNIDLPSNNLCDCSWFSKKCDNENLQAGMPGHRNVKLYQGWFKKYSVDQWDPLIFKDDQYKKPIMLCKIPKKRK